MQACLVFPLTSEFKICLSLDIYFHKFNARHVFIFIRTILTIYIIYIGICTTCTCNDLVQRWDTKILIICSYIFSQGKYFSRISVCLDICVSDLLRCFHVVNVENAAGTRKSAEAASEALAEAL